MEISPDKMLANADWIKARGWDLPTDVESFLDFIGGMGNLVKFMELPASKAMPEELVEALANYNPETSTNLFRE
jgi:hypothetical protein